MFLDEVDKIGSVPGIHQLRDVGGEGVQQVSVPDEPHSVVLCCVVLLSQRCFLTKRTWFDPLPLLTTLLSLFSLSSLLVRGYSNCLRAQLSTFPRRTPGN